MNTLGLDPTKDAAYMQLQQAVTTMRQVLQAYQDGSLLTREAGDQDVATNAMQAQMNLVFAINEPNEALDAAIVQGQSRLGELAGGATQPGQA